MIAEPSALVLVQMSVGSGVTSIALVVVAATGSSGHYASGRLEGAALMPEEGEHHYLVIPEACYDRSPLSEAYASEERTDNFYAHPRVVEAILEVAKRVRRRHLGAPKVPVGELSNRRGGRIPFHLSHQNGLDADIYFLQRPLVPLCHDGPKYEVYDGTRWKVREDFDAAANWVLVSELAERRDVKVIFIGGLVREALEAHARAHVPARERRRTMKKLVASFCEAPPGVIMGTYKNNRCPHDDHIHVRFACPEDSASCRERRRAP